MASDGAHFDFVVVGGGTAGNTVAGRLAENPNVSILVVEAGAGDPEKIKEITTPSAAMDLRGSQHDWAYKTTLVRRDDYERIEKPNTRGKVLGGSSSLNYFTWIPGCKPTFDRWEQYGGKEWTWDCLLPFLRKSATYHDDAKLYSPELKKLGEGGPLPISHAELLSEMQPYREALTKAWQSRGEPISENIYDGKMIGLTHCVDTIYKGQRSGSFLFVKGKPNITILSKAHSKRLIIDGADKKCKGVTVLDLQSGQELSFYADREVILSQGVFESPKLLMLSGIGPARELSKHGIDVVVDSPHVGQNLIDHPAVPFVLRVKDGYGMEDYFLRQGPKKSAAVAAYDKDCSGPLGSGLLELVGLPRIDKYLETDPDYRKAKAANEGNYITVVVDLVRPVSEAGAVTLRSADAFEQPDINLNFFANDLDIIAMREGVRFTYDVLTKGDGFKDLVESEYPWDMPLDSNTDMKRAVLDRCQTAFHPCGTARLSKGIDQGVVDPKLKVHGIKNLRLIDASVIPVIRIQNSVYMVGEKGADMIKKEHSDLYA